MPLLYHTLPHRMESDYDVIQDPISHSPPPHSPPDLTVSPDSEPDIYENLPCIIRQGKLLLLGLS